jgi:hypothetical protein
LGVLPLLWGSYLGHPVHWKFFMVHFGEPKDTPFHWYINECLNKSHVIPKHTLPNQFEWSLQFIHHKFFHWNSNSVFSPVTTRNLSLITITQSYHQTDSFSSGIFHQFTRINSPFLTFPEKNENRKKLINSNSPNH